MAEDTWFARDLPVLDAAVHLFDAQPFAYPSANELSETTGLGLTQVLTALRALEQAGLVGVTFSMGGGGNSRIDEVSGTARQLVGAWPSAESIAERLLAELEHRAETASSEEERGKWRRLLDSVLGVGRDVVVEVAAAAITRQVPGG